MSHSLKRRTTFLAAMISVLLVAGVAFAAWTSSGSGSGQAKSTTSVNSTISNGTAAADLFPGATKSVTVSINNPNDYPVTVKTISAGSSAAVNGCAAGTVTSDAVASVPSNTIAAGESGTYTLVTHMAGSATDACKSQTFVLGGLTATLESAAN